MCTQHPDAVSGYISTQEGLNETVECAMKCGCDEYMPDYEHSEVQAITELVHPMTSTIQEYGVN